MPNNSLIKRIDNVTRFVVVGLELLCLVTWWRLFFNVAELLLFERFFLISDAFNCEILCNWDCGWELCSCDMVFVVDELISIFNCVVGRGSRLFVVE
jgi:hypothetical protein